ncbi:MAG: UDP-2-acetamido-3-amino-2,3-dideoxy-glucuronate N-acetyltransferase [Syntrophus sp. SKADARSKE-3]|nr:UDP-2-acetamido-3-amino-2,3-dideoxy-glucuronate N-acetyltransferase [Syntrophus sp. SKADARSKE-3]
MKKNIKVAVIGAGYWGKNLVRNFHQLGALKTVCDADKKVQTQLGKDYPGVSCIDRVDRILNDPSITAVVIVTPAVTHFALAAKALQAGKHVFVEKPLAVTYDEGEKLTEIARLTGKILFVGHILHYHQGVIKLKAMISEGRIGRLEYIYSNRLSLGKIRREENILWSFAPHDISLILSIVGETPSSVDTTGSNFLHAAIADVTMTNLKFPSGIGAHIFVSWLNPFKEQRLVVVGSQGMLVFDDTQPIDEKLILYPHTINWKDGLPIAEKAEAKTIPLSDHWEEPLKAECRAFLDAVATGQPPFTSGEEGLKVLHVLELSQKSMKEKEGIMSLSPTVNIPTVQATKDSSVHETAIVDDGVRIGKGTKIWHFSHILSGSSVGEGCNIGQNVVIGPHVTVGNRCKIQNNVSVYPGVTLEDGVFCGPSMVFTNVYNPRAEIAKMDQARTTLVKKGATLGANSTIICGHTIGEYAFIGAGAVVTKDIPDHALVAGNPAKQIGWSCTCGETLPKDLSCPVCKKNFKKSRKGLIEKSYHSLRGFNGTYYAN